MSEQDGTVRNTKRGTERGQRSEAPSKLSKTNQEYWKARLKKRTFKNAKGEAREVSDWQVRMKYAGREAWFNLNTPNKAAAAARAKNIYVSLVGDGWDETIRKFKKDAPERKMSPTVGEFIEALGKTSGLRPDTLYGYASRFRKIVGDVAGIPMVSKRHDTRNGGRERWLERVNKVQLHKITPEKVQAWKIQYLEARSTNPI